MVAVMHTAPEPLHNMNLSEEDAEYEEDDDYAMLDTPTAASKQLQNGLADGRAEPGAEGDEDAEGDVDEDAIFELSNSGEAMEDDTTGAVKTRPAEKEDASLTSDQAGNLDDDNSETNSTALDDDMAWDAEPDKDDMEPINPNHCM